jgi:hypothetical protein
MSDAIKAFLDNTYLSNREVAKQFGVSEGVIRLWKKHPDWEPLKQKILIERSEVIRRKMEQNKEDYQHELDARQRKLKALVNGLEAIAAHSISVSGTAYKQASGSNDAMKACSKLTKSGVDRVARTGIETVKAIAQVYDQLDQGKVLSEYYQKIGQNSQDTLGDTLDV